MLQQYLEAGKLVTTHGVRGEVKLDVYCDDAVLLKNVKTLYGDKNGGGARPVESIRGAGRMAIVKFAGVEDIDAARPLCGRVLYFDRAEVRLPAGTWYIQDLLGCEVRDAETGKVYGTVKSIDHPGPQDIYTVTAPNGREYMFPGVPAFLKATEPEQGYILVSPIPGMLDDNADDEREPEED